MHQPFKDAQRTRREQSRLLRSIATAVAAAIAASQQEQRQSVAWRPYSDRPSGETPLLRV